MKDEKIACFRAKTPVTMRKTSPLFVPPCPSSPRPVIGDVIHSVTSLPLPTPPSPPPVNSIPTQRPIAHVRPTKPPISTPPVVKSCEDRQEANWKFIMDELTKIVKEEEFEEYLATDYTGKVGYHPST